MADPAEIPLTGGCLCGAVRFAIDAPLVSAAYCHCTRCQRRTGTAASANAVVAPGALRVTQGEEHVRGWTPPGGSTKHFCGTCGSALWARSRTDPPRVGVRLGALDCDPGVRPALHQHVDTAAAWEPLPDDGLPRFGGAAPR